MPKKHGIPYFSGEDYDYAFDKLDQWLNPKRGFEEFYNDPSLTTLLHLTAVPVGYASLAYAFGAEGLLTQHLWIIGRESGVINPLTASLFVGVQSMLIQQDTWDDIGDPMTGAIHYSDAGMMSGGSMPVVRGSRNGGPDISWSSIKSTFGF